jgi:hypothetical protein
MTGLVSDDLKTFATAGPCGTSELRRFVRGWCCLEFFALAHFMEPQFVMDNR